MEMPTTVQVEDDTRRLLEKLKNERRFKSYDQVIRWLVVTKTGSSMSLFGAARGSERFERESEQEHEL
jgi:predicted CopG family antitoxin